MDMFNRLRGPEGSAIRHQQKSRELEQSGLVHLQNGSLFQAKTDLQRAVGLDPQSAALRGHLAQVLAGLDLLKDADREFRTAITLSPFDQELRFAHAQLLETMEYLDDAAEEYGFASTLDPHPSRSLIALAFLEAGRGNIRKAEGSILNALERGESNLQVWASLCDIRQDMLLEEQRNLNRSIGLLAWGYDRAHGDRRIQTAIDGKKARRRKVTRTGSVRSSSAVRRSLSGST